MGGEHPPAKLADALGRLADGTEAIAEALGQCAHALRVAVPVIRSGVATLPEVAQPARRPAKSARRCPQRPSSEVLKQVSDTDRARARSVLRRNGVYDLGSSDEKG
jgi:hypothetical protein